MKIFGLVFFIGGLVMALTEIMILGNRLTWVILDSTEAISGAIFFANGKWK